MSSPSPQVKVPDLYRSSPASVMQIRSVSGMWPSQLFADANCEELVRSKHISIFREKSAPAEDRLNEAKTLLDEIESRVVALQRQIANFNSGTLQQSIKEATARLATS
ncbi:hypothetical protein ACHAPM_011409 [Fusarium culmorum]